MYWDGLQLATLRLGMLQKNGSLKLTLIWIKIRMSKVFYFCWLLLKPEVPSAAFNLVPFVLYLVAASISRNPGGR